MTMEIRGGGGGGDGGGVAGAAMKRRKRKFPRRLRLRHFPHSPADFHRASFPVLLAACACACASSAGHLANRLLRIHSEYITASASPAPSDRILPSGLISLLPSLLSSPSPSVAAAACDLLGSAAIYSLEANEKLASDACVVNALVGAVERRSPRVSEAACEAVLHLSTSSAGRDRLREASAVEKLLLLFCQVLNDSVKTDSLQDMERESNNHLFKRLMTDKFLQLALDSVIILINTSNDDLSEKIPFELVGKFLPYLKHLWYKIGERDLGNGCISGKHYSQSTGHELAAAIFRLSMNKAQYVPYRIEQVRESMFGNAELEFQNFVLTYWEEAPLLVRKNVNRTCNEDIVFRSLSESFGVKNSISILDSILLGLACPPIGSDELDITHFLHETKDILGSPISYVQDMRVLKAQTPINGLSGESAKAEVHFFTEDGFSECENVDLIQRCKDAFKDGYTVAIRGMALRSHNIAAIVDGVADLFGQPSVGTNVYLTPGGSQGLACHYDDHCVFVWQIFGQKRWRILPRPNNFLPRLYEPLGRVPCLDENTTQEMQFLLNEGDILYVPRGYPHEAHTDISEGGSQNDLAVDFSLHLTMGIEVEPPFEWEGFAHVALHCWYQKQKEVQEGLIVSKHDKWLDKFVTLLHVSIGDIAHHDSTFRKACLAGALPFTSDADGRHQKNTLVSNQKDTFGHIMNRINTDCVFFDILARIEEIVQGRNEEPLQWMRWLQHLPQDNDEYQHIDIDTNNIFGNFHEIVLLFRDNIEEAAIGFAQVKSKFCKYDIYADACLSFKVLLDRYRKARQQYMNGMLALHSACRCKGSEDLE